MAAFKPMAGVRSLSEGRYAQGLAVWDGYRATVWSPATLDDRLSGLVADSRGAGILSPLTAYMVVEDKAQEKILASKEKQALRSQNALEFEEPPKMSEFGTVWLLPVTILLLCWSARLRPVAAA